MPTAKVRLLSPQILLAAHGGTSTQTAHNVTITLGNGTAMLATYCPRSNLPYLAYTGHPTSTTNFWPSMFEYTTTTRSAYSTLLNDSNSNLTMVQKDVLGWHHHLSHASISWVQTLMCEKQQPTHTTSSNTDNIHAIPRIPSKYPQGPTCDITSLKCQSCLFGKAHRRPTCHTT